MKTKKIIAILLIAFLVALNVNSVLIKADENKIAFEDSGMFYLFKPVDEAIEDLVKISDIDFEKQERTLFIKSNKEIEQEDLWNALIARNPSFCYDVEPSVDSYSMHNGKYVFKKDNKYYQIFNVTIYKKYSETEKEANKEYYNELTYIENSLGLNNDLCNYERAAIIFDYIVNNIKYDRINGEVGTSSKYSGSTGLYTLLEKQGVCAGFAELFSDILNDYGIKNLFVGNSYHAWNIVEMRNSWYLCDTSDGKTFSNNKSFYCFLYGNGYNNSMNYIDINSKKAIEFFNISYSDVNINNETSITSDLLCDTYDVKAATETEEGHININCNYCNKSHHYIIPTVKKYSYEYLKGNCKTPSIIITKDGDNIIDEKEIKEDHNWQFMKITKTCTENGSERVFCRDCGTDLWSVYENKTGHNWTDWQDSYGGYQTRTCINCGESETREKEVETTNKNYSDSDLEHIDRGYGIIAYYDPERDHWYYIDTTWGELPCDSTVRVDGIENNGKIYCYWNESTHRFEKEQSTNESNKYPEIVTNTTTKANENVINNADNSNNNDNSIKIESTKNNEETTKKNIVETTKKVITRKPATVLIKSIKNIKKKSIKIEYKKAKYAKKYQVQYSNNKKFKKSKTKITKGTSLTIKSLTFKKKYYVRVRAINNDIYGKWSKTKSVIIKK